LERKFKGVVLRISVSLKESRADVLRKSGVARKDFFNNRQIIAPAHPAYGGMGRHVH
jgi:hypothetical protein